MAGTEVGNEYCDDDVIAYEMVPFMMVHCLIEICEQFHKHTHTLDCVLPPEIELMKFKLS